MIKIQLVPPLASERWTSMDLYADALMEGLAATGRVAVDRLTVNPDRDARWLRRQRDFYRALLPALDRRLASHRPDLVHFVDQNYAYFCPALAGRVPTVVTCNDLAPLADPSTRWYRRALYRHRVSGLAAADAIVCISNFTAADVEARLGIPRDRISVSTPGIDPGFHPMRRDEATARLELATGLRKDTPWVLHVGSNDARKNLPVLLAALDIARAAIPNLKLVRVGPATPGADIELPWLDLETLVALYNLADVVVLPSRHEGLGRPMLEAMACGTPVIAANVAALPEIGGDAILYHPPDDAAALAGAIRQVIVDPGLAARHRAAGLERARLYPIGAHFDHLADLYATILSRRSAPPPASPSP